MRYVRSCIICHVPKGFDIPDPVAYENWRAGHGYIQDIPGLTADQRELILSGICGACFDKITSDPDEDS